MTVRSYEDIKKVLKKETGVDPFFSYKKIYEYKKMLRPSTPIFVGPKEMCIPVKDVVIHTLERIKSLVETDIDQILLERETQVVHLMLYGRYQL